MCEGVCSGPYDQPHFRRMTESLYDRDIAQHETVILAAVDVMVIINVHIQKPLQHINRRHSLKV